MSLTSLAFAVIAAALAAAAAWWLASRRTAGPRSLGRDQLFRASPDAVLVLDEETVADANPAARELFGTSGQDLAGQRWSELFAAVKEWQPLPKSDGEAVERAWTRGETRLLKIERRSIVGQPGRLSLVVVRDITAVRRLEDELRRQRLTDSLTGLLNQRYFEEESTRLRAGRELPVAAFLFDLDGLKGINEREGHEGGDRRLSAMAAFLKGSFRAGDRIFRIGGDEFAVLLPRTAAPEAKIIQRRLTHKLGHFNHTSDWMLAFSLGWAIIEKAERWDEGLKVAGARLFDEKRAQAASRRGQ